MGENLIYILMFLNSVLYIYFYIKKSFLIDLKFLIAFLLSIFLLEFVCIYLHNKGFYNLYVYHIITFLEFNFLFLFFKGLIQKKFTKRVLVLIIYLFNIIYIISSLYYLFKGQYLLKYNSIASITGSVLLSILLFYFFIEFLSSNKILNYKKSLSFWIAFGLLVYYLATIPITSIINLMYDIPKQDVNFLFNIQLGLSIFMYCCLIFGALWSHKEVK